MYPKLYRMTEKYTDTVTTHTIAIYFIAMDAQQNCHNKAALLSVQRYPYMIQNI